MRDLSLHILDLVQNAVKAKANRIEVLVQAKPDRDQLLIRIADNGNGIPSAILDKVTDPFVTTRKTRSVGLGLPLLKEQCEMTGGKLEIESETGHGTTLHAYLGLNHLDRLPLGDLSETFCALTMSEPLIDFQLTLTQPERSFTLDWEDMRRELEDVPLNEPSVLDWLKTFIAEQQITIFGGVLHEIISRTGSHS